ncbi:hypothetical protein J3R30DRAFT_3539010 [Lentinula aciculospora]|uniref:Smr domain-containing protein n=1 Tax=Lentinula aciculospora TaxID=153920 RepID=A0A9W8ZYD0_9AGAR|nr:hypothetical protein J3R30DRAFT_3539010 [Lentinula aciculospora]
MDVWAQLFDDLQRKFCPPLDSSLVAAILLDVEPKSEPNEEQISALHATLSELASQTDVLQLVEGLSDVGGTDDLSTPSFTHGETSTSTSGSEFLQQPFSTPLGFLQAAFPEVQSQKLDRALSEANLDSLNPDMWDVVSRLLSEELILELEERGLDGLDDAQGYSAETGSPWEIIGSKGRSSAQRKKKQGHGRHKIALVNIRQQHHAKPINHSCSNLPRSLPAPDPWTQISSLSTHLAALLPSRQPSFFASYFHSPKYLTPYTALVEALQEISKTCSTDADYAHLIISLLDILLPLYDDLDPEQRSRLVSDTELSLNATQGHADEALDLVQLLRDLDRDSSSGNLEMGIYHRPAETNFPYETRLSGTSSTSISRNAHLPSDSLEIPPLPFSKNNDPATRSGIEASPCQWQAVPKRKTGRTHPLAVYIPAYSRDVNGMQVRGSGNGLGKGGKGDVGELNKYRKRVGDSVRKRDEMLREASRMWQKGNSTNRGGEVAQYFAERARQFRELAKKDALEAAKMMVESKRISSQEQDTIDLHGTTVSEAIAIASETLASMGCSSSKPLKIITGRGTHSNNQISVLKPALRKALTEDGWNVSTWDGGLLLRGKRRLG